MKHINIPFFVPHLGCPNTCVFCNQHTITGIENCLLNTHDYITLSFDSKVRKVLSQLDPKHKVQIAFFGGSFTAIEKELMLTLLQKAKSYVKSGQVESIRLSTRPDAIDKEILDILKKHAVSTIELGIQSTDNTVLSATQRGHSAKESENACRLIKSYGFELVGQMMLGLPCSTYECEKKTALDMIAWGVDQVRIYPTVVFGRTALANLWQKGDYQPLSLEEAVARGANLYTLFEEHSVEVIRMGLCESEDLRGSNCLAGAYHPAYGELIVNRYYLKKIMCAAEKLTIPMNAAIVIEVSPTALSKAIGQKRANRYFLEKRFPHNEILFRASPELSGKDVKITVKEN